MDRYSYHLFYFILMAALVNCNAYKILVISSMTGRSHAILGNGLVRHITNAGHEVTYVTTMLINESWPNVTKIDAGEKIRTFSNDLVNVQKIMENEHDASDLGMIFGFSNQISVMTLENKNVQKLMNDPNVKFDLIIAEWLISDIYVGLPAIFDCPFIWFSSVEPHWMILNMIDELTNPAYVADIISSNVPPFTFLQRLQELYYQIRGLIYQYFAFLPKENMDYERIIAPIVRRRGKPVPSFEELRNNVSLVLGNSHVSLGQATRLPQNYKPIGGFHIEAHVKPLPQTKDKHRFKICSALAFHHYSLDFEIFKDLQKLMDNAENGVIYFSLGSNLKSKELPMTIKTGLLKMFGGLKQTVIWKFEEELPNRPKNVHIIHWAPQESILAHPNCVIFITHGGYLSSTESVHFGVPIIGVPVYGDQFNNINRAVSKGYAIRVDLSYTMADNLKAAITEIQTVPKYKEKVIELSLIYHDRPVSPGDEVAHWVEHVIRTKGAPHLGSPAFLLSWYQKVYLDFVVVLLVVCISLKIFFKRLLITLWQNKNDSEKKKK